MVAFFDLDRTLIDCNSGRLWMTSELRAGRLGMGDVMWASYWLIRYHMGMEEGLEKAFEQAVATLQGLQEDTLDVRTRDWFEASVRGRLRPGARQALAAHLADGERCVLATSASVYEARYAAAAWGLETAVHTSFQVADGVFTGAIDGFAYGRHKLDRVVEWARANHVDLADSAFYTDSVTDLPVLEAVGRPVVVNPDRRLAVVALERGWPVHDWGLSG